MKQNLATRMEHELDSRSVRIAAWLYRRTRGRIARLYHREVLLLTTIGRRSGRPRTVPLQFFADGDDMVVVAANSGMPSDPAWYLNLTTNPEATVEVAGTSMQVRAEVLSAVDAEAFWPTVLDHAPDYARYRTRTDRAIPLVLLRPTSAPLCTETDQRRPAAVRTTEAALGFVGVTAVVGGIEMMAAPHGNVFVRAAWLDDIPIVTSYRLPGLLLSSLGAAALGAGYGLARRPTVLLLKGVEARTGQHWSWAATLGVGAALTTWIAVEVAFVPQRSPIEAVYALTGFGLMAACTLPGFRGHTKGIDDGTEPASKEAGYMTPKVRNCDELFRESGSRTGR